MPSTRHRRDLARSRAYVDLLTCVAEKVQAVDSAYPMAGPAPCGSAAAFDEAVLAAASPVVRARCRQWAEALAEVDRAVAALDVVRHSEHDHVAELLHCLGMARRKLRVAAGEIRDTIVAELEAGCAQG